MENNVEIKKIELFFNEYSLSKKSVLLFFEKYDKGIIREIKNSINNRAFENLFFRQFYFLLKNEKYTIFLDSYNFLLENKKNIILLLKNYHYELIFRDFLDKQIVFRFEVYDILIENILYIKKLKLKFQNGISDLFNFELLTINCGVDIKKLYFKVHVFNTDIDASDRTNGITFSIYLGKKEIYGLSFYVGKNNILLANIQKVGNFDKDFYKNFYFLKYNKILLYILINIGKKLKIKNFISFSNKNHPCKYHEINDGFKGDYINICENIGMKLNIDGYLKGNFNVLEIKGLNSFIKNNIDYYITNIYKSLKI